MTDPVLIREPIADWLDIASRQHACPGCDNTEVPAGWHRLPHGWLVAYVCASCDAVWQVEVAGRTGARNTPADQAFLSPGCQNGTSTKRSPSRVLGGPQPGLLARPSEATGQKG